MSLVLGLGTVLIVGLVLDMVLAVELGPLGFCTILDIIRLPDFWNTLATRYSPTSSSVSGLRKSGLALKAHQEWVHQ